MNSFDTFADMHTISVVATPTDQYMRATGRRGSVLLANIRDRVVM